MLSEHSTSSTFTRLSNMVLAIMMVCATKQHQAYSFQCHRHTNLHGCNACVENIYLYFKLYRSYNVEIIAICGIID